MCHTGLRRVKIQPQMAVSGSADIFSIKVDVTVTGKRGSNYRLSLSCNRKSKKLNLTNLFNSQQ